MTKTPIWIYDRNENFKRIIDINDYDIPHFDSWFTEEVNGAITLEFSIPANHPDAELIENDGRAVIRDRDGDLAEFIIRSPEDSNGPNGPIKRVFAEGGDYELIDEWMTGYTADNVNLKTALSAITSHTRWNVGGISDSFGNQAVDIKPTTVKHAIIQLLAIYDAQIRYRVEAYGNRITRRYIDVMKRRGRNTGKRFENGKDIQSITYTPDSTAIKTALYGYGASGENDGPRLTFSEVEWIKANGDPVDKPLGQAWVGDPESLQQWGYDGGNRHRFGEYSGQEEDAATLLLNTWHELQKQNRLNRTYEIEVELLENIPGYEHETVRLGDSVLVIDREVYPHIEAESNIIQYRQNLNDNSLDEVIVGDFRHSFDTASRVINTERVIEEKQGNWDEKETPEGAQEKAEDEAQKVLDEAQKRIDEAQERIDESKLEIEAAKERIEEAKQELEEAEGRIDDLHEDLATADNRINTALGDIGDLETDLNQGNFRITENSILTGTIGAATATFLNMTTRYMNAIDAVIEDATITGTIGANNATFLKATMEDATITGTLTARNTTIMHGTFDQATIVNADIEDATITGSLVGVGGTFTGTLTAVDGEFTGTLTAAKGSFTGDLDAAGGTFRGNLSAAGGTFSGTLQAVNGSFGTITSGTINTLTMGGISNPIIYFGGSSQSTANGWINYFDNSMRFQRDALTYYRVNSNGTDGRFRHQFYTGGTVAMNVGHSGSHGAISSGASLLKFSSSQAEVQVRNIADNSFGVISASNIEVGSSRYFKKNITDYTGNASELIKSTPVREYHLNEDIEGIDPKRIGLIVEESPLEIIGQLNGKTLSVDSKANILWKSVQEILDRVEVLENV